MPNHWVMTFKSVHSALKAEKVLKENGFAVGIIPVPRQLSSDCGIAIDLVNYHPEVIKNILKHKRITPEAFHKREK
jgi:hypothetical protein